MTVEMPALAFREELARYHRSKAAAALVGFANQETLGRFFPSGRSVESLNQCRQQGRIKEHEFAATLAHLGRATYEKHIMGLRTELESKRSATLKVESQSTERQWVAVHWYKGQHLGALSSQRNILGDEHREAARWVNAARREVRDLFAECGHARHADAGPAERETLATGFLESSADIANQLPQGDFSEWAQRFHVPVEQDPCGPKDRFRRIGQLYSELGLTQPLSSRVKVVGPHRQAHPRMKSVMLSPLDQRLSPSAIELGTMSELDALRCVSRALALSFASPGLPIGERRPCVGSVAHSFGWCMVQRLTSEGLGYTRREQDGIIASVLRKFVFVGRIAAAMLLSGTTQDHVTRAIACSPPPSLVSWLSLSSTHGSVFRSVIGSLCLWVALREQFDEDWYRNPRARPLLISAFEQGGTLSIEAWLEELGTPWSCDTAAARLGELVR